MKLRPIAAISGIYDAVIGLFLLLAADRFAALFGVAAAQPPIFSDLNGLFLLCVGLGYYWPYRDPIGARVSTNGQNWTTIVGVVGDTRQSLDATPADSMYVPLQQTAPLTALFLMRTIGPISPELPRKAREALYSIDANQPADQFRTLDEVRAQSVEAPKLTAMLIALFAGLAVAITAAPHSTASWIAAWPTAPEPACTSRVSVRPTASERSDWYAVPTGMPSAAPSAALTCGGRG